MSLTFGSLFAGIGGFDLGFERAGMVCKWQVEIDPFCQKVLAKHWPNVQRYADVKEVGKHNLEAVDVICGGFPCQDISWAGTGAGIGGARSGLWSEYYRIICDIRPRYVVVENVTALLDRGIDVVLRDLAQSGYDAWWDCLPAVAFNAPHLRDRVFIVAYTDSERQRQPEGETNTSRNGRQARMGIKVGNHRCGELASIAPMAFLQANKREWEAEPDVCRVANGVPCGVDRLKGLGNAVVPQIAEFIAGLILRLSNKHLQPNTYRRDYSA